MSPLKQIFLGSAAIFVFWLFNAGTALHSKTCAYLRIAFKVGWRLFKATLAICLFAVLGIILLMAAASEWSGNTGKHESRGGGSESERFFGFANSVTWLPQQVWSGFVILLQLFTLVVFLSLEHLIAFCRAHEPLCLRAAGLAVAIYTGWRIYQEWKWGFAAEATTSRRGRQYDSARGRVQGFQCWREERNERTTAMASGC